MRMTRIARLLAILLISACIVSAGGLTSGALVAHPASSESGSPPASEALSEDSVRCLPFGLYGDITTPLLVDRLSNSGDNLTFIGTSNGLYVLGMDGKLRHFLYSPFGVRFITLIDDITGDGIREVVIALNDTQVPALRCYDGATWEEVWQFAPTFRIWDGQWAKRQIIITNIQVMAEGDHRSLLMTCGRSILSVSADDGTEQWRFTAPSVLWCMATLPDLNDDGADEILVGSNSGKLIWVSAATGREQWRTQLPRHDAVDYSNITHMVSDIVVLDKEAGRVAVTSGDGSVHMFSLGERRLEWDTLVFKQGSDNPMASDRLFMSATADMNGDGLGELLLSKTDYPSQDLQYRGTINGQAALCDSAGNIVWDKDLMVWPGMAFETGVFEGRPVYLQLVSGTDSSSGLGMVDLRDGESVLHTVPLASLSGVGVITRQPGGDGFFSLSSDSDLAAVSAMGDLLWYYPRITNIEATAGSFVGDSTEDVLLQCECGGGSYSSSSPEVRQLKIVDGATGAVAWSYEVPYSELKNGGLKSAQVTEDLVGDDGVRDIVGCRGDTVFIFSGRDGTVSSFPAGQSVSSLEIVRNGTAGSAFALTTPDPANPTSGTVSGLFIMDRAGGPLWSTTTAEWLGNESGSFMMLDDINSDNVSDLAIFSRSRIVVLASRGQASGYELRQTIPSENGFFIRLPEVVADSDRDGVRELAYLQEEALVAGRYGPDPPRHTLCIQSLEDGKSLVKADLQGTVLGYNLACGDFNGDGYPDSVMQVLGRSEAEYEGSNSLRILSDKDGTLVWQQVSEASGYSFGGTSEGITFGNVPAACIGDINGDGADELTSRFGLYGPNVYPSSSLQQRLQVIDVAHDTILSDIALTPRLSDSSFGDVFSTGSDQPVTPADTDGDGHAEVITEAMEPSIPTYDPDSPTYYDASSAPHYLALVDIDSGQRLCSFTGFDPAGVSVLPNQQPGTLTLAACGGLCFLRLGDLQVTSPEDEARTGSTLTVTWESQSGASFSQVFVDGVRNDVTNGSKSDLYLGGGHHEIVVRSVDDHGRICYGPADLGSPLTITVGSSPWKPVLLVLSLFALAAFIALLFYARLHRAWRARRRGVQRGGATKQSRGGGNQAEKQEVAAPSPLPSAENGSQ